LNQKNKKDQEKKRQYLSDGDEEATVYNRDNTYDVKYDELSDDEGKHMSEKLINFEKKIQQMHSKMKFY
jgi:hypothetical protein